MLYKNKVCLILINLLIGLLFALIPWIGVSQTSSKHDVSLEIERILNRAQSGMNSSGEQIEQGNYNQAQDGTDISISSLSILLDLFMPLTERIKVIWKKEKEIVTQTKGHSKEKIRSEEKIQPEIEKLITSQKENIAGTQKALDAIAQQLKQDNTANNRTNQNEQQSDQKALQSQKALLDKVGKLLKEAKTDQIDAVDFLAGHEIKSALQSEIMAEKKLKEALDAFQKHQKQNSQQQQNNQAQQNSHQKQSQNKDQQKQKNSREQNQNQGRSNGKPNPSSNSQKKMSPKEALKELYRLRKETDAEKKRREKAAGRQAVLGRAPVEKDW